MATFFKRFSFSESAQYLNKASYQIIVGKIKQQHTSRVINDIDMKLKPLAKYDQKSNVKNIGNNCMVDLEQWGGQILDIWYVTYKIMQITFFYLTKTENRIENSLKQYSCTITLNRDTCFP